MAVSSPSSLVTCTYDGQERSEISQETTHVDVCESLSELPSGALRDLFLLVQVNLPLGLRVIGRSTFQFCSSLQFVTLPQTLQEIQAHAFEYCTNLMPNCKLFDLPEGITVIGDQAFAMSCQSIEYLQLPSTLVVLGRGSFSHWSNLVSVGMYEDGKLETIGDYAFYGAVALRNVAIPSTVNYVGRWSFGRCRQLQHAAKAYMFDSSDEAVEKAVRTRFEGLPLHKMMHYFDGSSASESEITKLVTSNDAAKKHGFECDKLGMTPLDILMLAPKPNYDLVPLFVQHFPETAFALKHGSTPVHYACLRKAPVEVVETLITEQIKCAADIDAQQNRVKPIEPPHWGSLLARAHQSDAIEILQAILRLQLNDRIEGLGLDRWKQEVQESISQLSNAEDRTEQLVRMDAIYNQVETYHQMEVISNLELCLWNACIQKTALQSDFTEVNREDCRIYSGSESILSNVIPFLFEVTAPRSISPTTCEY